MVTKEGLRGKARALKLLRHDGRQGESAGCRVSCQTGSWAALERSFIRDSGKRAGCGRKNIAVMTWD